jgi:outer membrane protein assembly factor BamD (BamD/ComL family)
MKNRIFWIFLLFISVALISCDNKYSKSLDDTINDTEDYLFDEFGQFNPAIAEKLVQLYMTRVDSLPKDSLTAGYLFKAADVSVNLGNSQRTLSLLDRFIQEYPMNEQTPISMFLKAFVYENQLNDTAKARSVYEEYINRFPESELIEDARVAIRNLGKSPEDLIREFESLNN